MAALLIGEFHHSLFEVVLVCAPILGEDTPESLEAMLGQLIPRRLKVDRQGESSSITPDEFESELASRIKHRLA